jgi:hypothetical protein
MHKYKAKPTTVGDIKFSSKAEAQRYATLRMLEKSGHIWGLMTQPRFKLLDKFTCRGKNYRAIEYVADFQYRLDGDWIVEDVKGFKTPVYEIKKKLFLSLYGNQFTFCEIRNGKVV